MQQKAEFLHHHFTNLLRTIDPFQVPRWGKMNVQQMIEHFSDSVRIGNGKDPQDLFTAEEHIPKMQAFLMSDKPFKENTVNQKMPAEPLPVRFEYIQDSISELQMELNDFFDVFAQDRNKIITNPFFGDLNYEMWVQLLHKHALHHLRQFGVMDI